MSEDRPPASCNCASALAQIQLSLVTVLAFSSKLYISLKTDTPEAQAPLFGTTDFFC